MPGELYKSGSTGFAAGTKGKRGTGDQKETIGRALRGESFSPCSD